MVCLIQDQQPHMASRREFLQFGVAASAWPLVTGVVAGTTTARPVMSPFYKLIFDERSPASRAWAGDVGRLGLPIHGIKGDVTELWFHDLDLRWKEAPLAIAGLTQESSLFCLELLARDRGMRVVYRAEHRARSDGSLEPAVATLWNWPPPSASAAETILPRLADDQQRLFSWVIAPKLIRQSQETPECLFLPA
jgi:hypothetical protein